MENLEKLVNDPEAMDIIASKESSMWAFMYSLDAFAALINSKIAMEKVAASETAVNVIIQAITDVANTEAVLTGIKEHLASVEGSLPGIPDGALKNQEVTETRRRVDSCVASLKKATSKADVLISSISALFLTDTSCKALASSPAASAAIANNQTCINALFNYRATTYKYIGVGYEMGKALENSSLKKTVQSSTTTENIEAGYGLPYNANGWRVNFNCNKFIALTASHSRANGTTAYITSSYHFDGKVFAAGSKQILNSAGNVNIFNFYEVAAGNRAFSSLINYSGNPGQHYFAVNYIPVTN